MIWLAIAGVALAVLVMVGRGKLPVPSARWLTAAASAVVSVAALYAGIRGQWIGAVVLMLAASYLGWSAMPPSGAPTSMSLADARALLGVAETATADDIRAAHRRLMQRAHPDQGGTQGLATQLNAARDRLLRG
jgi:membrane protein implicated in regulation of membrane protease activity